MTSRRESDITNDMKTHSHGWLKRLPGTGCAGTGGWSAGRVPFLGPLALAAAALGGVLRLTRGRRLRERHRRLVEREAARSALLRLVAHEVRAPLSLARGYVDMARTETLGPVAETAREALGLAGERLGEIDELADLLAEVARMQDSQVGLHLELLDLRDVLREAAGRARGLEGPGHRLVLDQPERPAAVVADRMQVRALLTNLIGNAIKYSPDGGEVRCTLRQASGSARVSVADHGLGIDPDRLEEVFLPFQRLQRASAPPVPGLGLGLFLAREIASAHHGKLSVQPNRDGGTTFHLWLPTATVRQSPQSAVRSPAPPGPALASPT
jgi:signal transduction histidine kinase